MEIAGLGRGEIGLGQYACEFLHWRIAPHPQVPKNTGGTSFLLTDATLDQQSRLVFADSAPAVESPPIRPPNFIHFTYLPS
jgi:hypothetical protein